MAGTWTEERRKAAAERCRQHKPWEKSTGPKTPAGKVRSSLNAMKRGTHSLVLQPVRRILKLNREFAKEYLIFASFNYALPPDALRKQIELIQIQKAMMANCAKNKGNLLYERGEREGGAQNIKTN